MLNFKKQILTKIISMALIQAFLFAGILCPDYINSSNNKDIASIYGPEMKLRVPMANSDDNKDAFEIRFKSNSYANRSIFSNRDTSLLLVALVSLASLMCSADKDKVNSGKSAGKIAEASVRKVQRNYFSGTSPKLDIKFTQKNRNALNQILNEYENNETCAGKSIVRFMSKDGKRKYEVDLRKERFIGHNFFGINRFGAFYKVGWIFVEGKKIYPILDLWPIQLIDMYVSRYRYLKENDKKANLEDAIAHELRRIAICEGLDWRELIQNLSEELGSEEKAEIVFTAISEYISYNEGLKMAEELGYRQNAPNFYKQFIKTSIKKIRENKNKIPSAILKRLQYEPAPQTLASNANISTKENSGMGKLDVRPGFPNVQHFDSSRFEAFFNSLALNYKRDYSDSDLSVSGRNLDNVVDSARVYFKTIIKRAPKILKNLGIGIKLGGYDPKIYFYNNKDNINIFAFANIEFNPITGEYVKINGIDYYPESYSIMEDKYYIYTVFLHERIHLETEQRWDFPVIYEGMTEVLACKGVIDEFFGEVYKDNYDFQHVLGGYIGNGFIAWLLMRMVGYDNFIEAHKKGQEILKPSLNALGLDLILFEKCAYLYCGKYRYLEDIGDSSVFSVREDMLRQILASGLKVNPNLVEEIKQDAKRYRFLLPFVTELEHIRPSIEQYPYDTTKSMDRGIGINSILNNAGGVLREAL
jgi:hypothetical protein